MTEHQPVLTEEVMAILRPERGGLYLDATLGLGGQAGRLLERAEKAGKPLRLIGLDQDEEALVIARTRLGEKIEYRKANFADLEDVAREMEIERFDGIVMDLGVSSYQLETGERGFSFQKEGPLDMRMDKDLILTAADIVNTWPEPKLADLFFSLGEERRAKKIARLIKEQRQRKPFITTKQLADLVYQAYPFSQRHQRLHPSTRVFQALRLEINQELPCLGRGLKAALSLLALEGRLVVISFHSLEDRIVKRAFREAAASNQYSILTKKPLTPTTQEIATNRRARSAKLRAIEKISI